jgi:hypothetical protein
MRQSASTRRAFTLGWVLPFALLALPNCALLVGLGDYQAPGPGGLDPGPLPHSGTILCDIESGETNARHCPATDDDELVGVRLAEAAVDLVTGIGSGIAIDDSQATRNRCQGRPEAITYWTQFPDGLPVCLNCGQIGSASYPDAGAACMAKCREMFPLLGGVGDAATFCAAHARASTNFTPPGTACYASACFDSGSPRPAFPDQRRGPEPVNWQDTIKVTANGNNLTRTDPTPSDPQVFDGGADSSQVISHGDGYVEFTASETDKSRLCGLSTGAPPDLNPNYQNIGYAIDLFRDGQVSIWENGIKVKDAGPYQAGEKFRVAVRANDDGNTATLTYLRVTGSCLDGHTCATELLYTSQFPARYPLRVDTSFHEQFGTLTNVGLVYIH